MCNINNILIDIYTNNGVIMKASDAKVLAAKHREIKATIDEELKQIYSNIESSAKDGLVTYHYHRGWLCSESVDSKFITNYIISLLKQNGYVVEEQYSNPNRPWLLISWM